MSNKIQTAYEYKATVVKWVDADSCDIDLDLGFAITLRQRVRIYGVNAPEVNSGDWVERVDGRAATDFVRAFVPPESVVKVTTVKDKDKYGRFLAVMTDADGVNIANAIIEAGHGKAYFGGAR